MAIFAQPERMVEEDFPDGKEMRSKGRLHRETWETGFQRDTSFHAGGGSQNKVGGNHCIYVWSFPCLIVKLTYASTRPISPLKLDNPRTCGMRSFLCTRSFQILSSLWLSRLKNKIKCLQAIANYYLFFGGSLSQERISWEHIIVPFQFLLFHLYFIWWPLLYEVERPPHHHQLHTVNTNSFNLSHLPPPSAFSLMSQAARGQIWRRSEFNRTFTLISLHVKKQTKQKCFLKSLLFHWGRTPLHFTCVASIFHLREYSWSFQRELWPKCLYKCTNGLMYNCTCNRMRL